MLSKNVIRKIICGLSDLSWELIYLSVEDNKIDNIYLYYLLVELQKSYRINSKIDSNISCIGSLTKIRHWKLLNIMLVPYIFYHNGCHWQSFYKLNGCTVSYNGLPTLVTCFMFEQFIIQLSLAYDNQRYNVRNWHYDKLMKIWKTIDVFSSANSFQCQSSCMACWFSKSHK